MDTCNYYCVAEQKVKTHCGLQKKFLAHNTVPIKMP